VQLFPAESRLVDTGNEYHLWVYPNPNVRMQIGFKDRFVLGEVANLGVGARETRMHATENGAYS
jgi:hypothetical protein